MGQTKDSSFNCISLKAFAVGILLAVVMIVVQLTYTTRLTMRYWNVEQMESFKNDSSDNVTSTPKAPCPLLPFGLKARIPVVEIPLNYSEIEQMYPTLLPGGRWYPTNCAARHKVAIIVPYRDREMHLKLFLRHMHAFLQKQQLDYGIYIIEQALPTRFNRGLLMNIGFVESLKLYDYQCFVLHDVDLLPESELNLYNCPAQPRHLSIAINIWDYEVKWDQNFGGVSELTREQMEKVNGFSNVYFGWGGEDDDFYQRIRNNWYSILKYPLDISRYTMIHGSHESAKPNPQRWHLLQQGWRRYKTDGLSSLNYTVLQLEKRHLYTWIYIDVNEDEVLKSQQVPLGVREEGYLLSVSVALLIPIMLQSV